MSRLSFAQAIFDSEETPDSEKVTWLMQAYRHMEENRNELARIIVGAAQEGVYAEGGYWWRELQLAASSLDGTSAPPPGPRIVCLCGSTRFLSEFDRATVTESLAGRIVLSFGVNLHRDDERFRDLSEAALRQIEANLCELHMRKIDLAHEVFILNVAGYVGEFTAREIAYSRSRDKPMRWLVPAVDIDSAARIEYACHNARVPVPALDLLPDAPVLPHGFK